MMSVFIEVAVGESPGQLSLADISETVSAASDAGASGVVLAETGDGGPVIDPSVVGSYLAGRYPALSYVIEAPTTHNAPYNLARRVLSLDRATAGRSGLLLRPGAGDEVSDATASETSGRPEHRWTEYTNIVSRLWESFPAAALRGDQEAAVVVDDTLIHAIDHDGRFYRVAGPLDGPSSVQGRPALFALAPAPLGWDRVARIADAVIVPWNEIDGADAALATATELAGRHRNDVALLARVTAATPGEVVTRWVSTGAVDGVVVEATPDPAATVDCIRTIVPQFRTTAGNTLRAALGLPEVAGVPT